MFTTREKLKRKTGKNSVDRFNYLTELVEEYKKTKSTTAKEEVLANLANFAYDPINYEFMKRLAVTDLFLNELKSSNDKIVEFATAGLCNICLDVSIKDHIINSPGGLSEIKKCLTSSNEETVLSAITTLIYLVTPKSKPAITTDDTVELMVAFSRNPNRRLNNLAWIFLNEYCTKERELTASRKVTQIVTEHESRPSC